MKTQISGYSDRPERRYSGVYQQQGRMLLDADANELVDILKRSLAGIVSDAAMVGAPRRGGVVAYTAGTASVRPGLVYADGLRAELKATGDPYTTQADFPSPPARPAGDHVLYVDVWERPVTALEDPALLDPALHGADTCSRTQMMAQLKWCPPAAQPPFACDLLSANPPCGDAELEVGIREVGTGAPDDPCDPCAEEVDSEARLGNYLFRLEVHDVEGPASAPTKVVLKWSSENASEAYPIGGEPVGYGRTDRMYERFDQATERLHGVHLATGYQPARGKLSVALPTTGAPFVRRWDGGCTLTRGAPGWALQLEPEGAAGEPAVIGRDRGSRLFLAGGPNLNGGHGAALVGDRLQVNLQNLTVSLRLKDRSFVAGDHWLAVVREGAEQARRADLVNARPVGVVHHYTTLGLVKGGQLQLDDADRRRFTFPPLTDLRAGDVGYDNSECALLGGAQTVEQALDRLCGLDAAHVAYDDPSCPSGLLAGAGTVEQALDALCNLEAKHVAFDGDIPNAADVDEALNELWDIARSGEDVCSALLALFGRGVVCGLIPTVRATVLDVGGTAVVTLTATTSAGTAINGRGCVRSVPGLTANTPMGTLSGGTVELDRAELERLSAALAELPTGRRGNTLTGIQLTPEEAEWLSSADNRQRLVTAIREAGPIRVADLRDFLAEQVEVRERRLAAELAAQIRAAAGGEAAAAETDDLWLYLLDPVDDDPSLEVRTTPPAGFPIHDSVRQAMLAPSDGPKIGAGSACPTAYDEAWSTYQRIACPPRADDGAVCLGRIGIKGDRAWVSPDDREQLFPTPAHTVSHWRSQRLRVHDKLKQACTAGPPTLQALEGTDGGSLDGRGFLADGSARTGVVRLGGPALGQAVAIDLVGQGVTVNPARIAIAPGDSSGVFTFTFATGATGAATIAATVVGDPASRRTVQLTGAAVAAPALPAGPLAGARVLAGEQVTITVGLTAAVSHPVTLRARASADVELRPPRHPDIRNEADVALAAGQKSAALVLVVAAGKSGGRELRVGTGALDVPAAFTAVALNALTRPNGSTLNGAVLNAGTSITGRVTLAGAAPRDLAVALGAQAGLTVPGSVTVSANQTVSGDFAIAAGGGVEGARTITASLAGHSVSVTVTISKPKDDIDTKNAKDAKDDKDDVDTKDKETSPQKEIRDDRAKESRDGALPVRPIAPLEADPGTRRPFIEGERRPDLL